FFDDWLYSKGMTDWCLEKVHIEQNSARPADAACVPGCARPQAAENSCRVTVLLRQKAEINEPTVLGFCLDGSDGYQVRIPIQPGAPLLELNDPPARIECLADNCVRVEVLLPCPPTQVAVDPDGVLLDSNPTNNTWKPRIRWRFSPVYTQIEETDLTNSHDRWNVIFGPWLYGAAYNDPWFTRSPMVGLRPAGYRTQEFYAGTYLAYRTDDRNIVAGVDGLLDHWPYCHTQVGFNVERSLTTNNNDDRAASRGVLFARYVFLYGS